MSVVSIRTVRHLLQWSTFSWIVLAAGIIASFLLFMIIRHAIEDVARLRFERQADDANNVIEERVRFYSDVLYGLRALFASQGPVSRRQFHEYVASLDLRTRYPGFDLVNYAAYVRKEDRRNFEESVRGDTSLNSRGYPKFSIKPAGERPEYYVMVYLEPMEGFEFAFGLDLGASPQVSDPQAVASAQQIARDSGKLTASGRPIRVKIGTKEYIGLAMRLAVYRRDMVHDTVEQRRAAYLGSVGAGFNVENLMKDVLDEKMSSQLRFRVYGNTPILDRANSSSQERLLFDSAARGAQPRPEDPASVFSRVLPVEVAGQVLEVHFTARKDSIIEPINRILPLLVLLGGILLSLFLSGVLYMLSSSRSQALKLAAQMTKDLRATSNRLVEVQESERRLLASELHDRVGQNLTALGLNLSIVANGLPPEEYPELAARLEDSSQLVQGTVDAMRDVMAELRPSALDDYGLPAALRSLAAGFTRRTGIQVAFEADEPSPDVPKAVDLAMFRIAQEALNNIAKHSSADRVEMAIRRVNGHATLSVRDNGVGIDPKRARASTAPGWGLLIMRERAESVGAAFTLRADPDAGVQVLVEYGATKGA